MRNIFTNYINIIISHILLTVRDFVSVQKAVVKMKKRMNELEVGEKGTVIENKALTDMKRRFLDIGLINGSLVECVGKSPLGDPSAYLIKGAVIAIREVDCDKITVNIKTP